MKKLTLTLCAAIALVSASYAGTESFKSGKESKQVEPAPCPEWYADNEWNVGISGIYAPTVNEYGEDSYLGVDHGWGAGVDIKYFFKRYFGLGVQGFGLSINQSDDDFFGNFDNDDNNDFAGGVLGTVTFRYPIPCSRFAPYAWVGAGGIFGGGNDNRSFDFNDFPDFNGEGGSFVDNSRNRDDDDARFMAQYGAGFEVRLTKNFGITNDISYNHLEGGQNDFIQVRTGLNFAF